MMEIPGKFRILLGLRVQTIRLKVEKCSVSLYTVKHIREKTNSILSAFIILKLSTVWGNGSIHSLEHAPQLSFYRPGIILIL